MATTTTPTYTGNSAGNIHASASLGAAGTANDNYDGSTVFETQVHVLNTPGGSVSGTRGLRVDVYRRYGSGPTTGESPWLSYTLPSATASTAESIDFFIPSGKYNFKFTNLDAAQAITVSCTGDSVTSLSSS